MKVSKEQVAVNRTSIVDAAATLYREQGFQGVGVAEITKAAGLTHGGLYRHFESKEALAAEACSRAFEWTLSSLEPEAKDLDLTPASVAKAYLTKAHRDSPGRGCPVAALAIDAGRVGGEIAEAFAQGVERYLAVFARHRADGSTVERPTKVDRQRAIELVTQLIGTLVLARAVAASRSELSEEIMGTIVRSISKA